MPDKCLYTDSQSLKLQEIPEDVPTGEMPRHMMISVERSLVDRVAPGTRVSVVGIASIMSGKVRGVASVAYVSQNPRWKI